MIFPDHFSWVNMKVFLAKNAGFCMGVRRAVETTINMVHREEKGISTFGPLIHNPQVLELLEGQGVSVLTEIPAKASGTIVIRAHGVPPEQKRALSESGAQVQDATCPRVVKVQAIIKKYHSQGFTTVIIGDRNHAEVVGLMGYAEPLVHVVSNGKDAQDLKLAPPYIIVSQTTQDRESFERLSDLILARYPDGKVFNTICDSTRKRQDEVKYLCRKVEAVVVVGGKSSANTQRLGEIAENMGCKVFMVETEEDLDFPGLSQFDRVGVTAGASTPTWMINRVVCTLEAIPGKGEGLLGALYFKAIWFLLATNLFAGLSGGALAYAGAALQNIPFLPQHFFMAFGYLLAMHNLNRFANKDAGKFNDPGRLKFFKRYQWPLVLFSGAALIGALVVANSFGRGPFYLLAFMSVLGIIYSVRVVPISFASLIKVRRLKEIPGSKTFFVALAWAFVTVFLPAWTVDRTGPETIGAFLVVLGIVFVRNALFDVFDVQGDRIVGKETLPVCIGEKATIKVLHVIIGVVFCMLLAFPSLGLLSGQGYWVVPAVLYLFFLALLYERGVVRHGTKLEFSLETVFLLTSVLVLLGQVLS